MKGVHWFGIKGKLTPCYVGPYPILEKFGCLVYRVELPSCLADVHNVFHISQLKKCLKPPIDMVAEDTILLEPDLTYKPIPPKFWNKKIESPEGRLLDSTKSSGTIIRKMK
jgi:hypothetical protein